MTHLQGEFSHVRQALILYSIMLNQKRDKGATIYSIYDTAYFLDRGPATYDEIHYSLSRFLKAGYIRYDNKRFFTTDFWDARSTSVNLKNPSNYEIIKEIGCLLSTDENIDVTPLPESVFNKKMYEKIYTRYNITFALGCLFTLALAGSIIWGIIFLIRFITHHA